MTEDYGRNKYRRMILGWQQKAEKIRNQKYVDWHTKISERLDSPAFLQRLAGLLGFDSPDVLPLYGTKDQLIAAVCGFNVQDIEKLHDMPLDQRDLMFAFAFVLGYEYRLITAKDGRLLVHCDDKLTEYFDDADMPLADYRNLDDYIDICAGMYYEECNEGKVYGKNRLVTLKELQDNLRNQLNAYMLDLDSFISWKDFYGYYTSLYSLSDAAVKKITGFTEYNVLRWKIEAPEKAEVLFLVCTLFRFNLIQTIHVFDRYYNNEDRPMRPDLDDEDDLRWLYLLENYWKLKELHYRDQIQIVKDYYTDHQIRRSADLSILQYYEIFRGITFSLDRKSETGQIPKGTIVVDKAEQLADISSFSGYDKVFVHAVDSEDPVHNAATDISLGYKMDILHATDIARILWYRKKTGGRKKDASEDLIRDIYYKKKPDSLELNMKKGAELLLEWIGDNSVNGYLMRIYELDEQTKTITMNKKLSDLQLKKGIYPKRKDLIIAGIILSIPEKGINALLKCYGYKPLTKHDYTEYILIQILSEMQRVFPSEFNFTETYTSFRSDADHSIQNIGKRRKADRSDREGCYSLLVKWYPGWFISYEGKATETVHHQRFYLSGDEYYTVDPQDYFERWSVRRHVLSCLEQAGFTKASWLYSGLMNPYREERNLLDEL